MANIANMVNGVMQLSNEGALDDLRNATIADCKAWSEEGAKVTQAANEGALDTPVIFASLGTPACPLVLALHPFGRKLTSDADPENPKNWKVVSYEILARFEGGKDRFPFVWYCELTREQRVKWTVECALLSAKLKSNGIVAKFNLQDCDYDSVVQQLRSYCLTMRDVSYELAEFAEDEKRGDGSIGKPPAKMRRLDQAVLDKYRDAALDDCGQGNDEEVRGYKTTLDLVKKQAARLADGSLEGMSFHTIKIDGEPANLAFNQKVLNHQAPAPTKEACTKAAKDMNNFVNDVWSVEPHMCFVVEATATTQEQLERVPALDPSDPRVCFQGCHCNADCVLVACEAATTRKWVASSSGSQASSAASA